MDEQRQLAVLVQLPFGVTIMRAEIDKLPPRLHSRGACTVKAQAEPLVAMASASNVLHVQPGLLVGTGGVADIAGQTQCKGAVA